MCLHHLDAAGAAWFPRPISLVELYPQRKISVPAFLLLLLLP